MVRWRWFVAATLSTLVLAGLAPADAVGSRSAANPPCVNRQEYAKILTDYTMTRAKVRRIIGTDGRTTHYSGPWGPYGYYSMQRSYPACNGKGYVLVAFSRTPPDPWYANWKSADWNG